jgi:hypothetical protein
MVWHQMSLNNLALLLPSQRVENRTQLSADLAEDDLPPSFGHEHNVVLAVPFRMGQALIKLRHYILSLWFTKPLGEDPTPGTVKPVLVSLVEPVAYPSSYS